MDYTAHMFSPPRFALILTITSIITALFFLGNIRYAINPVSRYLYRAYFVSKSKLCQCVGPSIYYEFRDRYAADTFTIRPENAVKSLPFLTLENKYITTSDTIVSPDLAHLREVKGEVLVKTPTSQMIRADTGIFVEFYAPLTELTSIHGFAQHFDLRKTLPDNARWHSTMTIHQ